MTGKNGILISHLLFTDDMLLFVEASMKQMTPIRECLDFFCLHLGQKVNVDKTIILFSKNVEGQLAQSISIESGFSKTSNLGKYLGVPLLHNRVLVSTYGYILKKIQGSWMESR